MTPAKMRATLDAHAARRDRLSKANGADHTAADPSGLRLEDFYAHLPDHRYIHVPTRELWPAASVDGSVQPWPANPTGRPQRPSSWLDAERAVQQMTWTPGLPMLIHGRIVSAGGWLDHPGSVAFNLYRAPVIRAGDASNIGIWLDHLQAIYPAEWRHIADWLAHRVQRPGEKVNHALVLGGAQGIGKDTLLEPVKAAIGHWNWSDIGPEQMVARFNGWAKAVVVRVNEARDLGDVDRFRFYDHSKAYIAAPPDVIRVDEKNLREHYVPNTLGAIITTNHRTDGLYLPVDDRRHLVVWSELDRSAFDERYWKRIWSWYDRGGIGDVGAWLRARDLGCFNPKAPPPRTEAFYAIVQAHTAPDDYELADAIERSGPMPALTIETVIANAEVCGHSDLAAAFRDRSQRRSIPHRMDRAGYVQVRNPNAEDGMWKLDRRRQVIYAAKGRSVADQIHSAQALVCGRCSQ